MLRGSRKEDMHGSIVPMIHQEQESMLYSVGETMGEQKASEYIYADILGGIPQNHNRDSDLYETNSRKLGLDPGKQEEFAANFQQSQVETLSLSTQRD